MKFFQKICLLLLLFLFPGIVFSSEKPFSVSEQKKEAVRGRELLLKRDYSGAEKLFQKWIQEYPDSLLGPFGMMTLYQSKNIENFDTRFNKQFAAWSDQGKKKALGIYHDPAAEEWDRLVAGGTLGLTAFQSLQKGNWWESLNDGIIALRLFSRIAWENPDSGDAVLGIGLYRYWRSVYTRQLWFLPFFSDQRTEGIEQVRQAAQTGELTGPLAKMALAYIHMEQKEPAQASPLIRQLRDRYPQNMILKMLQGTLLFREKKFPEAEKEFQNVLRLDPSISKARLFLATCWIEQNKNREAAEKELDLFFKDKPEKKWRDLGEQARNLKFYR
ncbi:MAG: tetratricopeptide repeat protein [bacterium]|nr:tetratricopeptide repeat protein [bacterium]